MLEALHPKACWPKKAASAQGSGVQGELQVDSGVGISSLGIRDR